MRAIFFISFFILVLVQGCVPSEDEIQQAGTHRVLMDDLKALFEASQDFNYRKISVINSVADTSSIPPDSLERILKPWLAKSTLNKPVHIGEYSVDTIRKEEGTSMRYTATKEDALVKELVFFFKGDGRLQEISARAGKDYMLYDQSYRWSLVGDTVNGIEHVVIKGKIKHKIADNTIFLIEIEKLK